MDSLNYVGLLQEKCSRARIPHPEYIEHEGSYNNAFKCTCKKDKWTSEGTGLSKKSAKHDAARLMLSILEREHFFELEDDSHEINSRNLSAVSILYEYCMKEKLKKPLFSDRPEEDDLFVVECSFNGFTGVGKGINKKKAKEIAADIVLKHFNAYEYFRNIEKCNTRLKSLKNSITQLHELCQIKKLNITYKEESIITDKQPMYQIACSVGDYETKSSRNVSKKDAKMDAATLMLELFEKITPASPPQNPQSTTNDELEESPLPKRAKLD